MKGWRPSAIPKGSTPDRALLRANFLPDIGSIDLSLFPVLGLFESADPGDFLLALIRLRRPQVGRKRRKRLLKTPFAIEMAPALHLLSGRLDVTAKMGLGRLLRDQANRHREEP